MIYPPKPGNDPSQLNGTIRTYPPAIQRRKGKLTRCELTRVNHHQMGVGRNS